MADDFLMRLLKSEGRCDINNMSGIPECLVALDREVVAHGLGYVDNRDAISADLTTEVSGKARHMTTWYELDSSSSSSSSSDGGMVRVQRAGFGQCGFLRAEPKPIHTSPGNGGTTTLDYKVYPVTAKHNLRRTIRDGKAFNAAEAQVDLSGTPTSRLVVPFRDLNWTAHSSDELLIRFSGRDVAGGRRPVWEFGIDITVGPIISAKTQHVTSEFASFEAVRGNFELKVGQKVGIAVIFTHESKPTKASVAGISQEGKNVNVSETKLSQIYGLPDQVNIYTGKITYVGQHHIEYDINTFTGCSGAVVFLLDEGQPASNSVQQCDFGKAIAVHGGSHPFIAARNMGFILPDITSFPDIDVGAVAR